MIERCTLSNLRVIHWIGRERRRDIAVARELETWYFPRWTSAK